MDILFDDLKEEIQDMIAQHLGYENRNDPDFNFYGPILIVE